MKKPKSRSLSEHVVEKLVENTYLPLSYLIRPDNNVAAAIDKELIAGTEAQAQGQPPKNFSVKVEGNVGKSFSLDLSFEYENGTASVRGITFASEGKSHMEHITSIDNLPSLRAMQQKLAEQVDKTSQKQRLVQPGNDNKLGI